MDEDVTGEGVFSDGDFESIETEGDEELIDLRFVPIEYGHVVKRISMIEGGRRLSGVGLRM